MRKLLLLAMVIGLLVVGGCTYRLNATSLNKQEIRSRIDMTNITDLDKFEKDLEDCAICGRQSSQSHQNFVVIVGNIGVAINCLKDRGYTVLYK